VRSSSSLKVKVPAGIEDGGRVRLAGQGQPGRQGGPTGDLILRVHVRPHPHLKRDGRDLSMTLPVTIGELIAGGKVQVPTVEGGHVTLTIPKRSQNGRKLRLKGKGVPDVKGGQRGDLYVVLDVRLPTAEDGDLEKIAAELERHYADEARRPTRL
jgi:DnaJ-class molecular chaperone